MKSRLQTIEQMVLLLLMIVPMTARADDETPAQRDTRMAWWRAARFGMFIHWGVYSVPAGTYDGKKIPGIGEWIMNNASIPMATYADYARQFNPTKFDADQWVSIAKNAGMKYIVITSKHHDGFAMFHSQASAYNIFDATPFKRDPLAELAEACREQNMKLGFYYSQAQDWGHPGGAAIRKAGRSMDHWDPGQDGSFDDYLKTVALPQVREILTNYGPVAVLWFDTPTAAMTKERAQPFVNLLHELQPQIIWNNRLGGGFQGDTETPEQFVPPTGFPGRDWETCMTINDTWGYKSYDTNFKSVETLLHNLIDIASKGGNYLLNVGPTSEGVIPQPEVDRLTAIGQWLKINGDAIYGTTASPFRRLPEFGRVTQKPGRLFLHVFNWPADGILWLPVSSKIARAYPLADPDQSLKIGSANGGVTIKLIGDAPDKIATVIVAETDGPLQVFTTPIHAAADGSFTLNPGDADLHGSAKIVTSHRHLQLLSSWASADDSAQWPIQIANSTDLNVMVTYSSPPDHGGEQFNLIAGDQSFPVTAAATKGDDDFATVNVGELSMKSVGPVTITLQPVTIPSGADESAGNQACTRRKQMNRVSTFIAITLGIAFLAGCSKSDNTAAPTTAAAPSFTIAVIPKGTTHAYWKTVRAGAEQAAKDLNVTIDWQGPVKENDRSDQIAMVQQFVAQGVNGIVIAPLDYDGLATPIDEATAKGIPVVVIDSAVKGTAGKDFVSFIATDNHAAGYAGGEQLAKLLDDKGKVVLLRYSPGSASTDQREQGFLDAIAAHPDMTVISKDQYGGATQGDAKTVALNMLDKLQQADGIFCPNESSTMGMLGALEQADMAGKVKFVGFDATPPLVAALRSKEIDVLISQDPRKMGYEGVRVCVAALNKQPVPASIDTGSAVVTLENVDTPDIKKILGE